MRGGIWPPALLCAAMAFALAFAPRHLRLPAIVVIIVTALATSRLPVPTAWQEAIFAGTWLSVIIAALAVHFTRLQGNLLLVLAGNSGIWAGAVTAIAGTPRDLLRALPLLLLAFPGAWLVANRGGIAIKVAASWLVAIAILVATLPIVPTPGYARDHLE